MSYSTASYTGDGSNTIFSVPFPYLDREHVEVFVDGAATSFSWLTDTSVTVSPAPAAGLPVLVKRTTPLSDKVVDFVNGSSLGEQDLDLAVDQLLYSAQEAIDAVEGTLRQSALGTQQWDALSKRITNLADPVDDTDAVNKQSVVALTATQVAAAQAAQTAAELAQAAAELAESNASTSETNAAAYAAAAQAAQAAAELAQAAAEAAQAAAEAAAGGVTFENLNTNGDVGTGADQVAVGNHNHDATYLALAGGTLTGNLVLKTASAGKSALGNTGATPSLDLSAANFFTATVDQAATFTFANVPANVCAFSLLLTNGGDFAVTWPVALAGDPPTLSSAASDLLTFITMDGGTSWHCVVTKGGIV